MDLGSDSSDDEDVEEFRYEMDVDEHRFLPVSYFVLSPLLLLSVVSFINIVVIMIDIFVVF